MGGLLPMPAYALFTRMSSCPPVSAPTSEKKASRLASLALSTTLAMHLPGPGTLSQASFNAPSDLPVIYLRRLREASTMVKNKQPTILRNNTASVTVGASRASSR